MKNKLVVGYFATAPLLSMFVIPAGYLLMQRPRERKRVPARLSFWKLSRAT